MTMELLMTRVEGLESRFCILEKTERKNMEEIIDLKEMNMSLHEEILYLKQTKKDREKQVQDTNENLLKGLGKVEAIQKIFNRMIFNSRHADFDETVKDLYAKIDALCNIATDLKNKVPAMETNLKTLEREVSNVQRQGLEEQIISLVRDKLSEHTDMRVYVVQCDGKYVTLDVERTCTLRDFKAAIERETGIGPSKQLLEFEQTKLTLEDSTLEDYGIQDRCVVILLSNDTRVYVVQCGGKCVTFDVERTCTLRDFKSAIERETGIGPSKQLLEFEQTKLTLEDSTLEDYGIQDRCVVSLSSNDMQSVVVQSEGKSVTLDVEPTCTITELKSTIEREMGVNPSKQVLECDQTLLTLEDWSLLDYHIGDRSVVNLSRIDMQIVVIQTGGKRVVLDVEPTCTITEFKSAVTKKTGISPSRQMLEFEETKLTLDDWTLVGYRIGDGSVVSLSTTDIHIIVACSGGKSVTLIAESTWTLEELKAAIERMTNICSSKQMLEFGQTNLTDGSLTLEGYGVTDNSMINLTTLKMSSWSIVVEYSFSTQRIRMNVDVRTSVEDAITKAHYEMKIPLDEHLALFFGDYKLDRTKLLVECGVNNNSKLMLFAKPKSIRNERELTIFINVGTSSRVEDEKLVALKVHPPTTVYEIKCQVHLETGVHPSCQLYKDLKNTSMVLNDFHRLSNCSVQNLSTLMLQRINRLDGRKQIPVSVYSQTGNLVCYNEVMDLSNTIWHLKCVIEDRGGGSANLQRLILNGFKKNSGPQKINPGISFEDDVCFSSVLSHELKSTSGLIFVLI